jgi:hemimethylated DNA binding protein
LIYVIKNRQGIPISLSCVYMMVGWRLGLDIKGCNLPRHFLTIIPDGKSKKLLDCFHAGKIVGEKEIATLSRESTLNMQDALKLEADTISIIRRVLGNLIFAYQQIERERDSFLMVHLLKEVQFYQDYLERVHSDPQGYGVPPEVVLYRPGQKVQHLDEGYRALVVDYDLYCVHDQTPPDEEDKPDYNQPWYKLLIHGTDRSLYVPHAQLIQEAARMISVIPWSLISSTVPRTVLTCATKFPGSIKLVLISRVNSVVFFLFLWRMWLAVPAKSVKEFIHEIIPHLGCPRS